VRKRRFNPHRTVHQIKFWAIEIMALIVFLNWAGRSLWHELGLPEHRPAEQPYKIILIVPVQANTSLTPSCRTSP
jgi:hypothetical protein